MNSNALKREIIQTKDGSTTIHIPDWNEQYHSKNGAIQEAYHVFIKAGLEQVAANEISILEIGFGTGLNAFITFLEAIKSTKTIQYVGVEAYPVSEHEVLKMNYIIALNAEKHAAVFEQLHKVSWEEKHLISPSFLLTKRKQFFQDIDDEALYNLIYFDAFGARNQPELWTVAIFKKMYLALKYDGILVTYAAKGSVRRAMQSVGFLVERLPGPPGKREMLRGLKQHP